MDHKHFSNSLLDWFDTQKDCNVQFYYIDSENPAQKCQIGAHKMILSMASDVFNTLFYGPMATKTKTRAYDVSFTDFSTFKLFLSFIYGRKITFETIEFARDFYKLAENFKCKDAIEFAKDYFLDNLSRENSIFCYEFGLAYNFKELQDAAWKIILTDDKILERQKFLTSSIEFVVKLYGMKGNLAVKTEKEFLVGIEHYIAQNLEKHPEIADKVRPAIQSIVVSKLAPADVRNTNFLTEDQKVVILANLEKNENPNLKSKENALDNFPVSLTASLNDIKHEEYTEEDEFLDELRNFEEKFDPYDINIFDENLF